MGSLNWASGLIPLGRLYLRPLQRHFHSLGLKNRFTPPLRSDPLVLANLLQHWQDLRFLTSGIPIRTFQADFTIFTDASTQGWGAHMGDSQISGTWTRTDRKLHINCLELKAVVSALQHSMELQRPRFTPVLPQWDLGIVLEALSKPPYQPLREASFKHLTLKTVFLLAMASTGRGSELHALRFDQNYIQFKPKGAGVTFYFSPEFMRKNQKPNQVNDPWYIPAVPTGKSEFGAPNCPVKALRYYHRYLTEHPELRKDRRHLFVPIKDNNAGKELSASTISRWICTTIVDSHAAIQKCRNLSGSVKAHEVRAVATLLQLFNKVDLHSVMKAGRWSSGGTFTSFYLRDLCPQADSLQRAGPIVAAGDVRRISSS